MVDAFIIAMEVVESQIRKSLCETNTKRCSSALNHPDFVINPMWFLENGLRGVTILLQGPGDYVMTHPRGPHFVLNLGFNVKEACSLGGASWVEFGMRAPHCSLS